MVVVWFYVCVVCGWFVLQLFVVSLLGCFGGFIMLVKLVACGYCWWLGFVGVFSCCKWFGWWFGLCLLCFDELFGG